MQKHAGVIGAGLFGVALSLSDSSLSSHKPGQFDGLPETGALVRQVHLEKQPIVRDRRYQAQSLARDMLRALKEYRRNFNIALDLSENPNANPLIGSSSSSITSNAGDLQQKLWLAEHTPQLAAYYVDRFKEARMVEGDFVVVLKTGSYPSYNVALYAALVECRLNAVVISSAASSSWGANIPGRDRNTPGLTEPDIENYLYTNGWIPFRSQVYSLGGNGDVGRNVTDPSKALEAVTRNQFRVMAGVLAEDASRSREEAVQQRLRLIESIVPAGREIKLIINNGGGTVASGGADGKLIPSGEIVNRDDVREAYQRAGEDQPVCVFLNLVNRGVLGLNMRNSAALKDKIDSIAKIRDLAAQSFVR